MKNFRLSLLLSFLLPMNVALGRMSAFNQRAIKYGVCISAIGIVCAVCYKKISHRHSYDCECGHHHGHHHHDHESDF